MMLLYSYHNKALPGRVAQSVTCTFVEVDHEMISTVILLPSAESFKKGCCQLHTSDSMCAKYWLTACSSLPRKMYG